MAPGQRSAVVQAGVTGAELCAVLASHRLHFPVGHISNVGIAGFTLGEVCCAIIIAAANMRLTMHMHTASGTVLGCHDASSLVQVITGASLALEHDTRSDLCICDCCAV